MPRPARPSPLVLFALASATVPAYADVDQENPNAGAVLSLRSGTQSFRQSRSNITGASIALSGGFPGSGNITVSLYDALPESGGNLLTSGVALSVNVMTDTFATVAFDELAVVPEREYFVVFSSSNPALAFAGGGDTYGRGAYYLGGGAFPDLDAGFRTFSNPAPTPAPGALFTALAGAVPGVAALWRRRKRERPTARGADDPAA